MLSNDRDSLTCEQRRAIEYGIDPEPYSESAAKEDWRNEALDDIVDQPLTPAEQHDKEATMADKPYQQMSYAERLESGRRRMAERRAEVQKALKPGEPNALDYADPIAYSLAHAAWQREWDARHPHAADYDVLPWRDHTRESFDGVGEGENR